MGSAETSIASWRNGLGSFGTGACIAMAPALAPSEVGRVPPSSLWSVRNYRERITPPPLDSILFKLLDNDSQAGNLSVGNDLEINR